MFSPFQLLYKWRRRWRRVWNNRDEFLTWNGYKLLRLHKLLLHDIQCCHLLVGRRSRKLLINRHACLGIYESRPFQHWYHSTSWIPVHSLNMIQQHFCSVYIIDDIIWRRQVELHEKCRSCWDFHHAKTKDFYNAKRFAIEALFYICSNHRNSLEICGWIDATLFRL